MGSQMEVIDVMAEFVKILGRSVELSAVDNVTNQLPCSTADRAQNTNKQNGNKLYTVILKFPLVMRCVKSSILGNLWSISGRLV